MHVFTVINASYMQLGLAWAACVRKVSGKLPTFVCADAESFEYLTGHGFPCELRSSPTPLSRTHTLVYGASTFPNDDAAYTVSLKFGAALQLLQGGESVLFSDVDAVWLRNPIEDLQRYNADLIVQPGSFPEEAKERWGFTACTGLFYLRACDVTRDLAARVNERFDGSDQRTLNAILLNDYEVLWTERPRDWEHCSTSSGWTSPVQGVCARTGLRLLALPHAYYQRHGTRPETCGHAIVCHPNSPKDQDEKIRIFRALGIDLIHSAEHQ